MGGIDSDLKRHCERELLRYAVSRALFCPDCGGCLDVDRAVYIDFPKVDVYSVRCGDCADTLLRNVAKKKGLQDGREVCESIVRNGGTVVDGRIRV